MNSDLYSKAIGIIRAVYGEKAEFREGQYEAIESTLTHHRSLVVQKTGWGKSLVYFVCTKILRDSGHGATFVVSPLLALMENQLQAATAFGLCSVVLNSSTKESRADDLEKIKSGQCDLVFITPETLFSDSVQSVLPSIPIGLFVVDEAHCISDWGHDFRLEYTRLNRIIRTLPQNVPVLGTTATANNRVIEDLKQQFGEDVYVSRGSLMRRSLSIQVLHLPTPAQRYAWMLQNIPKLPGSGIVYCLTQRDCDYIAAFLQENGINAKAYHSGMELSETENAEQALRNDSIKVLVATVKLGMGYDKGNIAFIIHYQQPSNIVAYYQQIGRAGRNIERAYTFLMCGEEDRNIQDYFIDTAFPSEHEARSVYDVIRDHSESGITVAQIEMYVNCRRNRVEKALMFLRNEEMIYKEGSKYFPTLHPFCYNREHYEQIKDIRRHEQQKMQEFIHTKECLSRFIVNCLDDPTTEKCGICSNCLGYAEYPEQPDDDVLELTQKYLERLIINIEPRKRFPNKEFTGSCVIEHPNQEGICLSKYGDPGYGMLVKKGKYGTPQGFCEELIGKSASILRDIVSKMDINALTCVPSLRSSVVADFAKELANRLKLPFVQLLQKQGTKQQKEMENSNYQCRNAWDSFSMVQGAINVPKRIILVDDIVDSGWTLTVCGYRLAQAGCELVFPFALADSSENRSNQ